MKKIIEGKPILDIPGMECTPENELKENEYYFWKDRVEGVDWNSFDNYNNILSFHYGRYIGRDEDDCVIFQADNETYEEAVTICTSNIPRIIVPAQMVFNVIPLWFKKALLLNSLES